MTLLLRVGHALGPFHPAPGEFARHHVVRVGWETPKLVGEVERSAWERALGRPDPGTDPAVLDALVARGLVARVADSREARLAFARTHRVQPLGAGTLPTDDGGRVLGTWSRPGADADPEAFDIWAWAHLFPTLEAAAAGLAGASSIAAGGPQPPTGDAVLDRLLERLPELMAAELLYLDLPRDAVDEPRP
ncbi:hypothetical protein SAMN05660199_04128 [Klenkia soli]|uniref:Uncharacterized protein n=1 Tax=Klenkia soli TaxID=1052260 RepID=A0A1H0TEC4_9ACTN|nr:hypothetical protein [Klenkia soli]SDP52402.1 hypothetical protein SAMN05660199_04128 [Klenkia soli]